MQTASENLTYRSNPPTKIELAFIQFHLKNQHVYAALEELALRAQKAGVTKLGIGALAETLRYSAALQTKGDAYKLNNNFRALYARMLIRNHPELRGLIELRVRSSVSDSPYSNG
jgi:hypothetical protein